ncbi:hypothetical protein, partial [Pseudomonas asiatica]|uniref:hypothetical protein n=6 Tax=Pseudomonas TaxID=286 RepID=UPI0018A92480
DLVAIIVVDNQLSLRDIRTHDQLTYLHCHGRLLTLWFFGLKGFHQEALACFYRRLQTMHSLSALWWKGWGDVSHGLYCCEQSESGI